mmetsp:Transcript_13690/g.40837  ORF Transcript_13690/g.40837 Transcript_13690/m.40837 type:complete len:402 (-) Transcript_13690:675-1880(-)
MRCRSELLIILRIHVSTHLQEQHRGLGVAVHGSHVDRRALPVILDVHVGAPLDEAADAVQVVVLGGEMESRHAVRVSRVHLDTVQVKELHEVIALRLCDDREGCLAPLRLARQVGPAAVAELRQAHVAFAASILEQGLLRLNVAGVDLRCLQHSLEHVHQHRAIPGDDLLQVEGPELLLRRLERGLQVREGIPDLGPLGLLGLRRLRLRVAASASRGLLHTRGPHGSGLSRCEVAGGARGDIHCIALLRLCVQQCSEGQVGSDWPHGGPLLRGLDAEQQDLHQRVLHLPNGDLVHDLEADVLRAGAFDLRMAGVVQEAPEGAHHLHHELVARGGQLAHGRRGCRHLLQEASRRGRRGGGREALVGLEVQEVQRHELLGVLPLHHGRHEVAHGPQGEEVLRK